MRTIGSGSSAVVTTCSCGRTYTAETWAELRYAGLWSVDGTHLELRHCVCRSTIGVRVDDVRARHRRTLDARTA